MTGYIRVSRVAGREGESFISPDVQRKQIQAWAKMRGVEIVAWYEDLDQSGGKRDRPGLDAFLVDLANGDTEGVVVSRLDRLSRLGIQDALALIEEIHEGGGQIASIDLGIDPTTVFGEFATTLMLAMARLERRRMSESWIVAKVRATERGVKIGPTPIGYMRDEDAVLQPHPIYGPVVTKAFNLAARVGPDAALAYLLEHGGTDVEDDEESKLEERGRTWTGWTLRRLLRNRSYLGEARYGDLVNLKAHEPLVSRAVWEAAQQEPSERRRPKATFPLSGLATCAACGNVLVGARGGNHAQRMYRCSAALASFKGERCSSPTTVTALLLEDLVRTALLEAPSGPTGFSGSDDAGGTLEEAESALLARERDLEDLLTDIELRRTLGAERFRRLAQTNVQAVDEARDHYRDVAGRSAQRTRVPSKEMLKDAGLEELGELLRGALQNIIVTRGRTPLAGRVEIVAKGMPAQGRMPTR
ncbi:MAG: recombinase family protein [Solirubrobacteraceae bacterium]